MSASKRDELVHKALKIFYRDGFHATGMDKLVKETGISKTSMYKHFRTKDDLILASLRLRDELFRNKFVRKVETLAGDPAAQLLAMFDALDDWFHELDFRGCMFIKASGEFPIKGSPIYDTAAEHKKLLLDYVEKLAAQTTAKDPLLLARQLTLLKEGAIVAAHMRGPEGIAADAKLAAEALIKAQTT
ncbi:MAG: TetR/AcrR family transcriptional regulator [Sneathiella sp.]|nr:TetR/AcrR family transcriptional regulator [Sneathiella sp.]